MHAIASYRGNWLTNPQADAARPPQTGPVTLHCAAIARSVKIEMGKPLLLGFCSVRVVPNVTVRFEFFASTENLCSVRGRFSKSLFWVLFDSIPRGFGGFNFSPVILQVFNTLVLLKIPGIYEYAKTLHSSDHRILVPFRFFAYTSSVRSSITHVWHIGSSSVRLFSNSGFVRFGFGSTPISKIKR